MIIKIMIYQWMNVQKFMRHMIGGIPTPPLANENFLESNF